MARMIIAGASETNRDQMSRLLASSGFSVYRCCASASSLRRALSESDDSIIIYIGIIPDCTPDELILDYGSRIQVLWIARQNVLESCDSPEIFRLTLPTSGQTILGALERHVRTPSANFQPMNANFGILEALPFRVKGKKNRYEKLSEVAIDTLNEVIKNYEL